MIAFSQAKDPTYEKIHFLGYPKLAYFSAEKKELIVSVSEGKYHRLYYVDRMASNGFGVFKKGPIARGDSLAIRSHKGKLYWLTTDGLYLVNQQSIYLSSWEWSGEAKSFAFDAFDQLYLASSSGLIQPPETKLTGEEAIYDVLALPNQIVFTDPKGIMILHQQGEKQKEFCEEGMTKLNYIGKHQWIYLKNNTVKMCVRGQVKVLRLPIDELVEGYTFIHSQAEEEHQIAVAYRKNRALYVYPWKEIEAFQK